MPTPPFSQHRRAWLQEVADLFLKKHGQKDKALDISLLSTKLATRDDLCYGSSDSAAVADRPRRSR